MKIAFFTYLMLEFGGGVAKYFIEVTSELKKRYPNLDIAIVTFDESALKKILFLYNLYFFGKQDRNLHNKEKAKDIKQKLSEVKYYKVDGLRSLKILLQKFDVIYSTNNLLEVLILAFLIRYENLPPVIFGFHIPSYYAITKSLQSKIHNFLYSSFPYKYAINGAKALHVTNSFDEKLFRNINIKVPIFKIYYPFDFQSFEKKAILYKYNYNWEGKKYNILWVGRLTEQKGVDDLILLINQINNSKYLDKIIWNIIGEGELKEKILGTSKKWENVHYLGYVENDYLPSIFKENDLFISTSQWESFPYNILETQCFGLPVIAYNIHGCNEIIDNNKNGHLVSSIKQFKEKILFNMHGSTINKKDIRRYIRKKINNNKIYRDLYKLIHD